jgi:ATP-dependent Clp protease ATP-binding subunit ClpB
VFQLLKKSIRPEFLNRIDEVSMFEPLNRESITKIAEIQLKRIKKRLEESKIRLELTASALDWLAQLGYDPQFGARPLKRVMQKRLLDELSKKILSGDLKPGGKIRVNFEKDLVFSND